ncbi:MAG: O-antigen ligase family protein [Actinomycetota bacterium]|nr:O-antigen ligase family protein [Actinomycetota bacterium]
MRAVKSEYAVKIFDRLPVQASQDTARLLWLGAALSLLAGLLGWATGSLVGGVFALWAFMLAAALVGFALPLPLALVAPLFMGLVGWLVDMLPTVILAGWAAVVVRWTVMLVRERRWPRGGRWTWLPLGLAGWTMLGVLVVSASEFRHFLLLLGIQGLISGVLLAVVDTLKEFDDRIRVVAGLNAFVVILTLGVLLQWVGIPVEELQNREVSARVEDAYGLDAFPNAVGMINYVRATNAGAAELRAEVERLAERTPELPEASVFAPTFRAFDTSIVVRFEGSARGFEEVLEPLGVDLIYDNVGLVPMNTVPRIRSFPRNALTYAGVCVALFPLALYLAWTGAGRRRLLGWAGVASCLFGAGFSLARGAWIAIAIAILYLVVDGRLSWARRRQMIAVFVGAAALVTGFYFVKYGVDPATGRAGARGSVGTRQTVYQESVRALQGKHIVLGYGSEKARAEAGGSKEGGRYVPRAGTHSTYLNYLFRTGVPGALGIVALYGISWLHARAAAISSEGRERLFSTLVAAAVFSVAAHAAILSLYVEPIYTLTVSLLLALAMAGAMELPTSVFPWGTRSRRPGMADAPPEHS